MEEKTTPDLKVVSLEDRRPKPNHIEGKERLDLLFEDFVKRGARPEMVAEMILAYGICELLNHSSRPEKGFDSISRLLTDSFNLNIEQEYIYPSQIRSFVKKDDDPDKTI
tara:strand:+ start:1059 stop:1388 length:330 start_codon:yes stop_codon:yes gene_type:complete